MTIETPVALSLEEKRRAFVRQRFGQDDVFGREDMWEFYERISNLENLFTLSEKEMRLILQLLGERRESRHHLDVAVTPFDINAENITIPVHWLQQEELVRSVAMKTLELIKGKISIRAYWGCSSSIVILESKNSLGVASYYRLRVPEKNPADENGPNTDAIRLEFTASGSDFLEALLAEWYRGQPQAATARKYCLSYLYENIHQQRATAEKDFNSAVAVSEDGRKIVHADEVHIGRYALAHFVGILWEPYKVSPAATYQQHKITRIEGELRRFKDNWDAACHAGTETKQGLILNGGDGKRVFFTTKEFCPPELLK